MRVNRYLLTGLVTLSVAPIVAAVSATTVDRRIDATPNGTVEVRNLAGSVRINGWDRNEVHVTGTLGENVERLDLLSDGDRVIVHVVQQRNSNIAEGTSLTIDAPRASTLDVDTVSADIDVRKVEGEQRLNSVSGNIDTEAFKKELVVKSVSGNVLVNGHKQPAIARAQAVSGRLRLEDVAGEVQADSVSGQVDVAATTVDRALLTSISGTVSLRTGLGPDARIETTTTSGNVSLVFDGDAAAEYDLATFSGSIHNCFGPSLQPTNRTGPQKHHRFREGNSNARVAANTMSGSIEVCRE